MNSLIIVSIFLGLSVLLNLGVAWYCIRLLKELFTISDTLEDLFNDVNIFSKHLVKVYELETFYGDQTLKNLLAHARALIQEFDQYQILFSMREPTEEDTEEKEGGDLNDNSSETQKA